MTFLKLIKAALSSYAAYTNYKHRKHVYDLEDEVDRLAADGSPAAKLRLERLSRRLQIERKQSL